MNYLKATTICTIILLILGINNLLFSQTQITGKVTDTKGSLAYVNIGIKEKNIGTISKEDGSFSIDIPSDYQSGSLTFSLVGYDESNLSIRDLMSTGNVVIELKEKPTQFEEVVITGNICCKGIKTSRLPVTVRVPANRFPVEVVVASVFQ